MSEKKKKKIFLSVCRTNLAAIRYRMDPLLLLQRAVNSFSPSITHSGNGVGAWAIRKIFFFSHFSQQYLSIVFYSTF